MRFEHWLYTLPLRVRSLFQRRKVEDELDEEIRNHIEHETSELVAHGMTPEHARAAARRKFGGAEQVKEECRDNRKLGFLDNLIQDLRYAFRQMRRNPAFTLAAVLTLGLGIGASTAIFSVVYSVLLRPLPYPSAERLVWLGESTQKATGISVTWINFQHWRAETHSFEDMAGFNTADLTMTGRGDAVLTHAGVVTSDFFALTGPGPLLGRLFTETDDLPGAEPAVVVSPEFWNRTLGGDPSVLGQSLALNGKPYQIIGVLRPGLKFFSRPVDMYLPRGLFVPSTLSRGQHQSMHVLGLLKPGTTLAEGRADLNSIMQRLAVADPGPEDDHQVFAEYLTETQTGEVRPALVLLMGAVGLILALACANVASLLLVRGTARAREIAIRAAIGAGRFRIARQLLTENLAIAVLGGGLGLLVAELCLRTLVFIGPPGIPRLSEAGIDPHVLVFATAVTIIAGLVAGTAPVFSSRDVDLTVALKEGSAGAGAGARGHFLRSGLVVAEFAITLVLLFASGLLIRSLVAAETRYPGFDAGHLLALELQLPPSRYKSNESIHQFYSQLIEQVRSRPGVEAVGAVTCPPSAGDCGDWWYSILGKPEPARGDVPLCLFNTADTDYFNTMRMRLLAGRQFTDQDRENGPAVVVINEELASKWWPAPDLAVGQQIKMGGPYIEGPVCQIVGVVGSVSQMGLDTRPMPEVYYPFLQRSDSAMVVMIRTTGEPSALADSVRAEIVSLDRNVPIQSLSPFEKWVGAPLERRRFITLLLAVFAGLAVVLASVGIYGVLSFWVSTRQKEIAIRLALGARRTTILRWAGFHAIRLAVCGMGLGAFGAWAASRWLKSLAFGVSLTDPRTIAAAALGVILVAGLAVTIPLRRAVRVDAGRTLHDD
jgi:predicted permease